ncbi:hypothetical protein ES677_05490 [Bizionia gelidisalsuginis]|uniref:Uncharacterized protein n=2 Tax=Bizionia TaxID=283785 RepID=A0A8H2QIX4_9FLAO|nr:MULTISPECIES: hypothetical protein [Bizionia]TYB73064.1 hypothetical protein ES676_09920 [Bizionia saleffrena]TYC14834.1 hypothetical protein ES677_05490 [Bizionia gelidisalsuginis]
MDFEELLKLIKEELIRVLGESYSEYKEETKEDIEAFLAASRVKLERWTTLLVSEDLTVTDYEWLVKSQKDILVLEALYKAGASKRRLGHLKNKIIKTVVDTVVRAVL